MEIPANKTRVGVSELSSSNEDLSQYTDAEDSISAPTEILAEFLSALMIKDYSSALKLCKIILQYKPDHDTVKQFNVLLQEKLAHQEENINQDDGCNNAIEECSDEDESSNTNEEIVNNSLTDDSSMSFTSNGEQNEGETNASYSSLEDEVADLTLDDDNDNTNPKSCFIPTPGKERSTGTVYTLNA